jgi:hypothetical protein
MVCLARCFCCQRVESTEEDEDWLLHAKYSEPPTGHVPAPTLVAPPRFPWFLPSSIAGTEPLMGGQQGQNVESDAQLNESYYGTTTYS